MIGRTNLSVFKNAQNRDYEEIHDKHLNEEVKILHIIGIHDLVMTNEANRGFGLVQGAGHKIVLYFGKNKVRVELAQEPQRRSTVETWKRRYIRFCVLA